MKKLTKKTDFSQLSKTDQKKYKRLEKIGEVLDSQNITIEERPGIKGKPDIHMHIDGYCPYCSKFGIIVNNYKFRCSNCFETGTIEELEEFSGINNNPDTNEYIYYNVISQPILKIHHNTKRKKNPFKFYEIHNSKWREEKILRIGAIYNVPQLVKKPQVLFVESEVEADIINQKIKEEQINNLLAITNAGGITNRQKGEIENILQYKTIYIVLPKTIDKSFTAQQHALWLFNLVDPKTREKTKIIDPGFNDNENIISYLERKNLTIRKFLEHCKNQKNKIPPTRFWQELINPSYKAIKEKTDSQIILERLKVEYDLHFNLALLKPEFKKKYEEQYTVMDEREMNTIILDYEHEYAHPKLSDKTFQRIINSHYLPSINPYQEYFNNLDSWDVNIDHITELARTVKFNDIAEQQRFEWVLKKFLVGVVATSMTDRPIEFMLLFAGEEGGQGSGKTTWLGNLSPTKLKRYHTLGRINFLDKDSYINLSQNMLIQLDEFDQYTRYEASIIKNFITQRYVNIRRHYGKGFGFYPRYASFTGSLNKNRFLTDDTGNRRFLIFIADKFINFGNHGYDMDKVFAQAFTLWQNGFRYWLNAQEIEELNEYNKRFIVGSIEEELIENYFRPATDADNENKIKRLQTFEIIEHLKNTTKIDINENKVSRALYRLGFQKKSTRFGQKTSKAWAVILL